MSEAYDATKVGTLLADMRAGVYDVPHFQRVFSRDRIWVADLMTTLLGSGRIGALLVWQPQDKQQPAGRYRRSSDSALWVVDGQQRMTGIAAAFGEQPPWMTDSQWRRCGGPRLEVSIGASRDNKPVLVRAPSRSPHVPLGHVYRASDDDVALVLRESRLPNDSRFALRVQSMVHRLLDVEVLREWLRTDLEDAYENFVRRNKRSTQIGLKPEELALSVLAHTYEPLLPTCVDPIIDKAAESGLAQTVTRRRVNNMLQRMLPHSQSNKSAVYVSGAAVATAAERLTRAHKLALAYLSEQGLTCDELISAPSLLEVLVALFDRFEHARLDTFAPRWMAHVLAGSLLFGRPTTVAQALDIIQTRGSYANVCAGLAALTPAGPPAPFSEPRLHVVPVSKRSWGPIGGLYAMVCASGVAGRVSDLAVPDLTFPDPRMRLRPLCENPMQGMIIYHAFMSDATAEVIGAHRGWTRDAYDELQPSDLVRSAHQLPVPPADMKPDEVADWLTEHRGPFLARGINDYLAHVGPLWEDPQTALFVPQPD
ncbi:DUF262 domain-containing protein [Plantactinospora solaniradicis]|uniref:DUF262 domain-containing protein n=1 Tax=Plantactinospora solaniradicis TaxID=1723736 RepID=A0ABW1KHU2_9ACTN